MQLSKNCWKTTLILLGLLPFVLCIDSHGAALYEQYSSQGANIELTAYAPELTSLEFDNRAHSACILGVWFFYTEPGYNYGDMQWAQTPSSTSPFCFDLLDLAAGLVSSVRHAGSSSGVTVDTFNLYQYFYYLGAEELTTTNKPSLSLAGRHASIVITGMGQWTVFEEADYTGPSHCLIPVTTVTMISDITEIGIQHGSLRSVRKGCDANPDSVVYLPSAPMSGSSGNFSPISHLEKV